MSELYLFMSNVPFQHLMDLLKRSIWSEYLMNLFTLSAHANTLITLASGIDVGQGINVGPGKFGKNNKRRALNTHVLCSK